jgi:hypothetical protein
MITFKDEQDLEQFQVLIEESLMKVWHHHMKPELLNYNDEVGQKVLEHESKLNNISGWLGMTYFKKYALSFAGILTISILIILLLTSFMI